MVLITSRLRDISSDTEVKVMQAPAAVSTNKQAGHASSRCPEKHAAGRHTPLVPKQRSKVTVAPAWRISTIFLKKLTKLMLLEATRRFTWSIYLSCSDVGEFFHLQFAFF